HRDKRDMFRKRHAKWTRIYAKKAKDNPVAGRMAAHLAAIRCTARLAHVALTLPWAYENPVEPLYDELTKEAAEADRAAAALRHALSWAVAHRRDFSHHRSCETDQPHG